MKILVDNIAYEQSKELPSTHKLGDPVLYNCPELGICEGAIVVSVTFTAGKVFYSLATYKGGVRNVVDGVDSTFVTPYKISCRCMSYMTGDTCTQDVCPRRESDSEGFREKAINMIVNR